MKNVYKKLFEFRKLTGKVVKGANNPFHKTKYADLNSVIEATDEALEEVGLIWIDRIDGSSSIHELIDPESGEMLSSTLTLNMSKQDSQSYGSALTYNRRYARVSMLGLQTVDEDGNVSSGNVYVKPKAIKEINELILKTKTDTTKFLQYFHVDSVKNLTEQAGIQAIKTLTLKLEKDGTDGSNETN